MLRETNKRPVYRTVRGIFSMDTQSGTLSVQTLQGSPVGGGVVKGNGRLHLDPAMEHDPSAVYMEFLGEGLNPLSAAPYMPALQDSILAPGVLGPVSLQGRMQGALLPWNYHC
jgi:hypothetical protein